MQPGSWVGHPSATAAERRGWVMQSPSGPKVYPKVHGALPVSRPRGPAAAPNHHGLGVTDLPFSPSSRPVDRARRCFCLFCATPAGCSLQCAAVCALVRERRAVEPRPHVWAKLYPLLHAVVLYCMSLWVCSRSAEHVVSAATQIAAAANKNMRAAAAQSEASFMPRIVLRIMCPATFL